MASGIAQESNPAPASGGPSAGSGFDTSQVQFPADPLMALTNINLPDSIVAAGNDLALGVPLGTTQQMLADQIIAATAPYPGTSAAAYNYTIENGPFAGQSDVPPGGNPYFFNRSSGTIDSNILSDSLTTATDVPDSYRTGLLKNADAQLNALIGGFVAVPATLAAGIVAVPIVADGVATWAGAGLGTDLFARGVVTGLGNVGVNWALSAETGQEYSGQSKGIDGAVGFGIGVILPEDRLFNVIPIGAINKPAVGVPLGAGLSNLIDQAASGKAFSYSQLGLKTISAGLLPYSPPRGN